VTFVIKGEGFFISTNPAAPSTSNINPIVTATSSVSTTSTPTTTTTSPMIISNPIPTTINNSEQLPEQRLPYLKLTNLGNTCFLNSTLQLLFICHINGCFNNCNTENYYINYLLKLFKDSIIEDFFKALQKASNILLQGYLTGKQRDAGSFLVDFFRTIDNKDGGALLNFKFDDHEQAQCKVCNWVQPKKAHFYVLQVSSQFNNISQQLNEMLNGQKYCENCKKQCEFTPEWYKFPNFIILETDHIYKNMDLNKCIKVQNDFTKEINNFKIIGISLFNSYHYTAVINNQNNWFMTSDLTVQNMDKSAANTYISSRKAVLIAMRKIN